MMKNKTTKAIVNGVVLAAMAALGITVYQLGTSSVKEKNEEIQEFSTEEEQLADSGILPQEDGVSDDTEEMVDAGTSNVEASLEDETAQEETDDNSIEEAQENEDGVSGESEETLEDAQDASVSAAVMPVVDFAEDTLMEWPVNGNIMVDYSMDQTTYFPTLDQYKLSPAIAVQAVEGAPVVAAVNGTVYSIEQDAQTGTTVTMELGNGYQAIYGQLTDLTVSEGETVTKGTTIGYIDTPTKYYSLEGSNLYFAMKKDGEPIDPIAYLP